LGTNITRIVVKNYRSLADVDIALHPLTVLVGANGSGKSNVVDVLRFVRDLFIDGFASAVLKRGGIRGVRSWFADESQDVMIQLHFEGSLGSGEFGFAFGTRIRDEVEIKWERLGIKEQDEAKQKVIFEVRDGKLVKLPEIIERIRQSTPDYALPPLTVSQRAFYLSDMTNLLPAAQAVRDFLINMNFYDLSPDGLREPQKAGNPFPLSEKGDNLGATLRELRRSKENDLIVEPLGVIAKGLEDYSVKQVGDILITRLHYVFDNGSQQEILSNLTLESDGTLRLLAILAALYQKRCPSPLAIEEPEKGLYPDGLALLCGLLQGAADSYQVLVTTHSPDLITYLPADTLQVVEKVNGITKVGPLSKSQYDAIAENIFSPGALMRIEGLERQIEIIEE
jgi:predicted ATPase